MLSQLHALEKTIFLCYSPADRAFARQVADFLESGAAGRVFFDEGAIGAPVRTSPARPVRDALPTS